jgi:hypothetical protein
MHHSLRCGTISLSLLSLAIGGHCCLAKSPATSGTEVELFAAINAGELEVKLFLKDASGGTAVLKNLSARPLTIRLPEAVGAAPVAAQFFGPGPGAPGAGPGGVGNNAGLAGNQNVGGAFQPGGNNNRNGGPFGPGLFNIEAGKERKLKICSVCLEHGKDEPNPRLAYELRPLAAVCDKPEVRQLVATLATGDVDHQVVQAAAWHLANGMSWNELAKLPKYRHLNGITERYFTAKEIERARGHVDASKTAARDAKSLGVKVSRYKTD